MSMLVNKNDQHYVFDDDDDDDDDKEDDDLTNQTVYNLNPTYLRIVSEHKCVCLFGFILLICFV